MKKIFTFFTILVFSFTFSQMKEVLELRKIDKKYDSILIAYQEKAKDSLSSFSKKERNKIMAQHEGKICDQRDKIEYALLEEIKRKEDEERKLNKPKEIFKCNNQDKFTMPNLKQEKKYKPTISKVEKNNNSSDKESLKCTVTFIVSGDGNVKDVRATGDNKEFNREAELILYKIEKKWAPVCENGIAIDQRLRLPITMNFE